MREKGRDQDEDQITYIMARGQSRGTMDWNKRFKSQIKVP